jgi:DNA-binding IclR family transcriptional regulator
MASTVALIRDGVYAFVHTDHNQEALMAEAVDVLRVLKEYKRNLPLKFIANLTNSTDQQVRETVAALEEKGVVKTEGNDVRLIIKKREW